MSPAPSRWKVVLVVEDVSDGRAIKELAARNSLDAQFDSVPARGAGNIKKNCERLIALAQERLESGRGCVGVLVDRDRKDPSRAEANRAIADACRRAQVEFIAASDTLEAWFLADPGICQWLDLAPPPSTDEIADPKRIVEHAFYRKTRRRYTRLARVKLALRSTGIDVGKNKSARQALTVVQNCLGEGR